MEQTERKNEILAAAKDCFSRFGYEKTTLDDIGKIVGLNKASLYHYYKNKEAIFKELIYLQAEDFIVSLTSKMKTMPTCDEKIIFYLLSRFTYFKNTIDINKLSDESTQKFASLFRELILFFRTKEVSFLKTILDDHCRGNLSDGSDTGKIADMLITVSDGIKHKTLAESENCFMEKTDFPKIKAELEFIIPVILRGLKGPK
ncbi:MAG: TetR/AcrR family transcriptional regulator [Spirochaetes bacterium]|nr:TetR/AcrR family transcriptional regulator [Spirochaetota bacterium]